MVTKESAVFSSQAGARYQQLSRDVDHSNLGKFTSRADQDYINLRGKILDCVAEAPTAIGVRFTILTERNITSALPLMCP